MRLALLFGRSVYRETFETRTGRIVMAHLRKFCGERECDSPFFEDALTMARMAGRAEVYREIRRFLTLTDEQIEHAAREAAERSDLGPS